MKALKGKYTGTVKVGEKGQALLSKKTRDIFDTHSRDTLILLEDEKHGIAILPKSTFVKSAFNIFTDMLLTMKAGKNHEKALS